MDGSTVAVLAVMAAMVSAGAAGASAVTMYRGRITDDARSAVRMLHAEHVVAARQSVRRAGRERRLSARRREEVERAALVLMLVVQTAQLQRYAIKRTALVVREGAVLYSLLDGIVADLGPALRRHGHRFDWQEEGRRTNTVLDALPKVRNEWSRRIADPPEQRLPVADEGVVAR